MRPAEALSIRNGLSMRSDDTAMPETGPPPARPQAGTLNGQPAEPPATGTPAATGPSAANAGGQPARWLTTSILALGILAAASATVSYAAQYRMVLAVKAVPQVAALEAGIPDVAALIFATLGIALALHGKRAIRARLLNLAAVITSVTMNVLAAGHGWRDLAIWAMPPVAYALASDTAIGVVRSWTIARHKSLNNTFAEDETTPLAILGRLILFVLRLTLAPASTLTGFRAWVLTECPVAPGRRASDTPPTTQPQPKAATAITTGQPSAQVRQGERVGTKTARFLALVTDRYGPLASFPLPNVSRVSAELAPEVDLNPGAARTALRRHVLSLQNGTPS